MSSAKYDDNMPITDRIRINNEIMSEWTTFGGLQHFRKGVKEGKTAQEILEERRDELAAHLDELPPLKKNGLKDDIDREMQRDPMKVELERFEAQVAHELRTGTESYDSPETVKRRLEGNRRAAYENNKHIDTKVEDLPLPVFNFDGEGKLLQTGTTIPQPAQRQANPQFDELLAGEDPLSRDIGKVETYIKEKFEKNGIDTSKGLSAAIATYVGLPTVESDKPIDPTELCEKASQYQDSVADLKNEVLQKVAGVDKRAVDSVFERLSGANPEQDLCPGLTTGQLRDRAAYRG